MWKKEYLPEPAKCDICEGQVYYHELTDVFGTMRKERTVGMWKCRNKTCGALVSCHPGTRNPVGYMAGKALRRLRTECHKVFDLLWCKPDSPFTRHSSYYWLSTLLGIPQEVANISKLTEEQLLYTIEQSKLTYRKHQKDCEVNRKGALKSYKNKKIVRKPRKGNVKVTSANYQNFL